MEKLSIFVNGEIVFDYDRDIQLDEHKLAFLDKMDADMSKGIKIQGQLVENPEETQRLTFMTMNLLKALKQENEAIISSSCAYIINRRPALIEIHVNDAENGLSFDFTDEEEN